MFFWLGCFGWVLWGLPRFPGALAGLSVGSFVRGVVRCCSENGRDRTCVREDKACPLVVCRM